MVDTILYGNLYTCFGHASGETNKHPKVDAMQNLLDRAGRQRVVGMPSESGKQRLDEAFHANLVVVVR